ncbi:MAG: signal peptidase II [Acidimicrobiales bacterium]
MRGLQERRSVVTSLKDRRPRSTPAAGPPGATAVARRPHPWLSVRRLLLPAVAAAVVAGDQVSKTWALHHAVVPRHVLGPVWLNLTFNSGAAFGLGQGVTPVVEAVVALLVVWLLAVSRRASRAASVPVAVGLGLVLGGALGNLAGRVLRDNGGRVIDFIAALRIGDHDWWPVFNVADASIVVGAIILVITYSTRRHVTRG